MSAKEIKLSRNAKDESKEMSKREMNDFLDMLSKLTSNMDEVF